MNMDLKSECIPKCIAYLLFLLLLSVNLQAQNIDLGKSFKGSASFYHKNFSGRKTASGERLNNNDYTCAHKFLPFGTMIEVENPITRKWVIVRVNDRGPFSKSRVLDLSYEAAKNLGMISKGVLAINAKVVGKEGEIILFREGSTESNFQEIFPKDNAEVMVPFLPESSTIHKKN